MKMKHVYDCDDVMSCVEDYQSGLTQSKESKQTRPLLEEVNVVEFRKGSTALHFKTSHLENELKTTAFLMKKTVDCKKTTAFLMKKTVDCKKTTAFLMKKTVDCKKQPRSL